MLSLPPITPRDSHELWFGSSNPYRSSSQHLPNSSDPSRRHGNHVPPTRSFTFSTTPSNSLAALLLEERALRARKQNIASFGYTWLKPAGCPKTMLGMREEEVEREEGLAVAMADMGAAAAVAATEAGVQVNEFGDGPAMGLNRDGTEHDQMERDLDDDIPDADAEGLVEEGEEGLEDEDADEDLMERNLDDDIPDAFPDDDDDDDEEEDYDDGDEDGYGGLDVGGEDDSSDNQPDLDDDVSPAEGVPLGGILIRDLDEDVPDSFDGGSGQGEAWQHTDTEAEDDDDEDNGHDPFAENFQTRTPNTRLFPLPSVSRETEVQRRFLERWGGGGDTLDSSEIVVDDDDFRASIASRGSRRAARLGRGFSSRAGPRDSLD